MLICYLRVPTFYDFTVMLKSPPDSISLKCYYQLLPVYSKFEYGQTIIMTPVHLDVRRCSVGPQKKIY